MAVQGKINSLKVAFDKETKNLRAKQHKILEADRIALENRITERKRSAILLEDNVADLVLQRGSLEKSVIELQTQLEAIQHSIYDSRGMIDSLNATSVELRKSIVARQADKRLLEVEMSEKEEQREIIRLSIDNLQRAFKHWKQQSDTAETEYTTKVSDKERIIEQLDAKILKVTQDLEERHNSESSTRDQLARMQKAIDERDRNLRVREAKIEQGENKLIQNANLMNL